MNVNAGSELCGILEFLRRIIEGNYDGARRRLQSFGPQSIGENGFASPMDENSVVYTSDVVSSL